MLQGERQGDYQGFKTQSLRAHDETFELMEIIVVKSSLLEVNISYNDLCPRQETEISAGLA